MYPGHWAQLTPDKPAVVMTGSGEVVTYGQLDDRSNQIAQLAWDLGMRPGSHMAVFLENTPRIFEAVWAGLRSGFYVTTVNRFLSGEEASFVVDDCGAELVITSWTQREAAVALVENCPKVKRFLMAGGVAGGVAGGYESFEEAIAQYPSAPLADEPRGELMLYSSGTTGRPKGIRRPLSGAPISAGNPATQLMLQGLYGFDDQTVYLSPAPLYHSAPIGFSLGTQIIGGTVVAMEHFDPIEALRAIETHRVTHSQWVPTMFVRMLKLDPEERATFDLSSHRCAVHAAAPCPVPVKQAMLDWWGPIIHEYYGGTEVNGLTYASPQDWLAHPGTVGKAILGVLHICDDGGAELPAGQPGVVYFELPELPFEYHNDPAKTKSITHPDHPNWSALGDVGYVDDDGFLYLTDRATFMIISGGVNIYPQEIENALVVHPKVADVAVVGVPDSEMGEAVKAVVQPVDWSDAGPELAAELDEYCRAHLAHYKCPRSFDFEPELPRLPTGKLYKRLLKDRYWAGTGKLI